LPAQHTTRATDGRDVATSELDRALELTPLGDAGAFAAELHAGWLVGNAVNGGLLMALAGQALSVELSRHGGHPDPFAVSAYYLSAATPGPATVRTDVLRTGRTVSTGQVSLHQPGADGADLERMRVLATYGDLDSVAHEVRTTAVPPELPPPERCVRAADAPPTFLRHAALLDRLDLRLDPATAGWAAGRPSGLGQIRGWLRLADGRGPDPMMLLLACDALPPVAFDLGLSGWTPTLELTVHVRARPAPGWLRIGLTTRNLAGGFLEEDAEVWDSGGRLVAQSRQLARVSAPPSGS
jgi:acyl-coenzyme A thioesterase PaaI-like protein